MPSTRSRPRLGVPSESIGLWAPPSSHPEQSTLQCRLAILNESLAIISIVASLLVISSYVLFPKLRKLSFKLIVQLALANLLFEVDVFLGATESTGGACTVHTVVQSWFSLASVFWTVVISYCMFAAVLNQRQSEGRMPRFILFSYGVPLLLALLPLSAFIRTHEAQWCWANPTSQTDRTALIWRTATFYVPLWLCVIYHTVVFRRLQVYMNEMGEMAGSGLSEEQNASGLPEIINRLRIYPIILICCWLPGTLNRAQNMAYPSHPILALQVLHIIGRALQGPLNALAYLRLPGVRKAWTEALSSSCAGDRRWLPTVSFTLRRTTRRRRDSGPEDGDLDDDPIAASAREKKAKTAAGHCRCTSGPCSFGCELGTVNDYRRRRSSLENLMDDDNDDDDEDYDSCDETESEFKDDEEEEERAWTQLTVTGRFDEEGKEEEQQGVAQEMQGLGKVEGKRVQPPTKISDVVVVGSPATSSTTEYA